jgi:hypothetical protein
MLLEVDQHYTKQTYKNRAVLLSPQGPKAISVPIKYRNHQPIRDVKVDHSHNWLKVHLGMMSSSYGKAAFFDHYFPEVEAILQKRHHFLIDLLSESLTSCLEWLGIQMGVEYTQAYIPSGPKGFFDAREQVLAKRSFSERPYYKEISYFQNFGNIFEPNLSVLDCLFNMGPEAKQIIVQSSISA